MAEGSIMIGIPNERAHISDGGCAMVSCRTCRRPLPTPADSPELAFCSDTCRGWMEGSVGGRRPRCEDAS